ncbi:protein-L-isoaspartate(D-aspartate) O-methyltransferase [Pelagibaculum spongiae]|uniref:Protein-L-isoaspartate O-methyltransferase n=2 Tax=Pelagibaculum spongiae TaxID=2080658 RepID=A0A2V1GPC4_9GAMM|nr:protein-L-isoaspartate(D-aspartate) O-methyltransferase [Pelagibaculum spongiae]PVZ64886.1 protein-L-isoaspartate(D-aspartate) O-methyltransferase [Pelagibaculum spongiae]
MTSQRTRDRLVKRLEAQGITNQRVLESIAKVPRHLFIDEALSHRAYEDTALPIGLGQTISQPFMVAKMTELVLGDSLAGEPEPQRVLEIGTGSGYQTAVLATLVPQLFSIERIAALKQRASGLLFRLGLNNVRLSHADGYEGWPAGGEFEAIIVTAAPPEIPQALLQQLADGGRLIIPVGDDQQQLQVIRRRGRNFETEFVESVKFVPLLGGIN